MLILNKSFDIIQKKCQEELEANGISNTPGSIARLFSAIINTEQAEFYDILTTYHAQCFVSTANGEYLDKIGELLNCKREYNEVDDDYRYRIVNQTLVISNANYTAIRLAALSVDGVDDIKLVKFSSGIGSFSIYVLNNDSAITIEMVEEIVEKVSKVVGFGIKFDVLIPEINAVELSVKLIFDSLVKDSLKDEIRLNVKKAINNYITNLGIGEAIILNELTQLIMQENDNIMNYSILEYKIDNESVLHTNHYCDGVSKFSVSTNQHSIKVY